MKRTLILVVLVILTFVGLAYTQCDDEARLTEVELTCRCGIDVIVNACAYGTSACEPAKFFIYCGECLVGDSGSCPAVSLQPGYGAYLQKRRLEPGAPVGCGTKEFARLEKWVASHPGLKDKVETP